MKIARRMGLERIPPAANPVEECCYCWYVLHPTLSYPETWSSTVCEEHSLWMLAEHVALRARRSGARQGSRI
jgi:hypothetical protein